MLIGNLLEIYDKKEQLYFCNTEYTEDMENDNWKLSKEII